MEILSKHLTGYYKTGHQHWDAGTLVTGALQLRGTGDWGLATGNPELLNTHYYGNFFKVFNWKLGTGNW